MCSVSMRGQRAQHMSGLSSSMGGATSATTTCTRLMRTGIKPQRALQELVCLGTFRLRIARRRITSSLPCWMRACASVSPRDCLSHHSLLRAQLCWRRQEMKGVLPCRGCRGRARAIDALSGPAASTEGSLQIGEWKLGRGDEEV